MSIASEKAWDRQGGLQTPPKKGGEIFLVDYRSNNPCRNGKDFRRVQVFKQNAVRV